jgi:hypothetical protein
MTAADTRTRATGAWVTRCVVVIIASVMSSFLGAPWACVNHVGRYRVKMSNLGYQVLATRKPLRNGSKVA